MYALGPEHGNGRAVRARGRRRGRTAAARRMPPCGRRARRRPPPPRRRRRRSGARAAGGSCSCARPQRREQRVRAAREHRPRKRHRIAAERRPPGDLVQRCESAGPTSSSTPWSRNATTACAVVSPPGSRGQLCRRNPMPGLDERPRAALERDERDRGGLRVAAQVDVVDRGVSVVPTAVGALPLAREA